MSLTPYPSLRLKLSQPNALKLQVRGVNDWSQNDSVSNANLADMPAWTYKIRNSALIGDPVDAAIGAFTTVDPILGDFVVGFRSSGEIRKFPAVVPSEVVTDLADGATVTIDAALGNVFHLTALGDRTLLAPVSAPGAGRTQKLIIRHEASGANRLLSLTTGSAGAFRFGSTITGITVTLSGKVDWIGCLWNQPANRWDVVAYAKGY